MSTTTGHHRKKAYRAGFFSQMRILLKRNSLLQIRQWKSTFSQAIFFPVLVLLLLFCLQKIYNSKLTQSNYHPQSFDLSGVKSCQGRTQQDSCINILYTPDTEQNRLFLQTFAAKNKQRTGVDLQIENISLDLHTPPKTKLGMVPVANYEFIYNYTLQNPNKTLFGIEFSTEPGPPANYRYQVWFNSTLMSNGTDVFGDQVLSLVRGLDEAIIASVNDPTVSTTPLLNVQLKDWPKVPSPIAGDEVVSRLGPVFFFCTEMIIFIAVLNTIVAEKEKKLKHNMIMMGMSSEAYWFSLLISNLALVVICALLTCGLGIAFGFSTFKGTDFRVLLITFVLFGFAMMMAAFFITTLVRRTRVAILIGIFFFVIGLLFESFVFSSSFVGYVWWDPKTSPAGRLVLMFFPFFNFGKIILDISLLTAGSLNALTDTVIPGPGFHWKDLFIKAFDQPVSGLQGNFELVPPPVVSWYLLLMNIGVYGLLTWYFDKIVPDEFGFCYPPWFFLKPSFWIPRSSVGHDLGNWIQSIKKHHSQLKLAPENEDDDVYRERDTAYDTEYPAAVRIVNLRKIYKNRIFKKSKLDKVAVRDLCLTLEEGKLLALLGQNGAGKSTTMNILSGLTPATSGDAWFYGYTRSDDIDIIRGMLGVCPQHDILFDDLTAAEHIELYACLKGVPRKEIPELIKSRLEAVRLWKVANKCSAAYSGGMKRRLSVVISTLGDPKIVFMDEPTTGMDPVNRRHVWSFIEQFKENRVIILTTHSMEEADVLGDRIAIMALGRLCALGNSTQLKNKFGTGYRISMVVRAEQNAQVRDVVAKMVPGAKLEDDSAGSLIYQFPSQCMSYIPVFVRYLEEDAKRLNERLVQAWGISQTTLEEVFLRLIREANPTKPKLQ
ncbi:hypothetical protein K493DRAFT_316510 [Basidiobolus meristosporus CBS 931.73]|uniref:ABC transporter domain-containing protein n=1 Tax=Basidiobolus meristosporus CBS 931.73 TaxID=1314790 RepID=A0A1Y1Y4D9_9FUNG|nr:hypothetical protein K493DRAFT_316510 [Basidiobolus meristosporus CBS 931.73]|eukprot:ORX92586.1 hypothetical protein K493DRAFT_316510 [Basidiobolus meristosporus CBS 931.73]